MLSLVINSHLICGMFKNPAKSLMAKVDKPSIRKKAQNANTRTHTW